MSGGNEVVRFDEQVRSIADRFDDAWEGGRIPDLAEFLPPPQDSRYLVCLLELVKVDLQFRWSRGLGITVEQYLLRFPALGPKEALDPALIYAEYRARSLHGDRPTLASYDGRFPKQFKDLQLLISSRPIVAIEPPTTPPVETDRSKEQSLIIRAGHVLPFGGGYQLVRKLGKGSFAEVWEAKAPGGHAAAVKRLLHSIEQEEAQSDLRSLEYIKRLSHPYLLQTQASFLYEDYLFVVMELAAGTLGDLLKKWLAEHEDGMPANEVLPYIKEAAEALDYMHSQDVLHRDIKPANLLYLQGHVKVGDFGLSRVLERSSNATVAGTYPYMAPEVLQGKASPQIDQYSLAKTYAHLRQGKRFVVMDMFALIQSCGKPVPLDPLPAAEQAVLHKALDTDPGKRFESCLAFTAALEKALAPPAPASLPSRQMVLAFTDLVDSVALKSRVGDPAYRKIISRHDAIFKKTIADTPGAEIMKDTGDGFMARFSSSSSAVVASLRFQHALRSCDWGGESVFARVGIHAGEVAELEKEGTGLPKLVGLAADVAARVMGLALPAQILMTRAVYDDARMSVREHPFSGNDTAASKLKLKYFVHGKYLFKGHDDPVDIYEVGASGLAPLAAPPDSEKARKVLPEFGTSRRTRRGLQLAFALLLTTLGVVLFLWLRQPPGFKLEAPEKVSMAASEVKNISLSVSRFHTPRPAVPVHLTFEKLPPGVSIRANKTDAGQSASQDDLRITIPAGDHNIVVEIRVLPDATPGAFDVDLNATSDVGKETKNTTLHLEIGERPYYLPPDSDWKPAENAELRLEGNKLYYDKIDVSKGTERVRFLFIPADVSNAIKSPFYIMEDKVWFGLYKAFANDPSNSDLLKNSEWREKKLNDGDSRFPVMGVLAPDAHAFAKWLGGARCLLPAKAQWDKAAGKYDPEQGREGPFEGDWSDGRVAVNLPRPVNRGQSQNDRSFFHVRDMSGNGKEWTRTGIIDSKGDEVTVDFDNPPAKVSVDVRLRGRDFREKTPLSFKDFDNYEFELLSADPHPAIGFRVVIEP